MIETKKFKRIEPVRLIICTNMTHLLNFQCLWCESVPVHCSKVIGVLESISESMAVFSDESNNLVKLACNDPNMIYAMKNENVIQLLSMVKPQPCKKALGNRTHDHGKMAPRNRTKCLNKSLAK